MRGIRSKFNKYFIAEPRKNNITRRELNVVNIAENLFDV